MSKTTKGNNQFDIRRIEISFNIDRPLYSPEEVEVIIKLIALVSEMSSAKLNITTIKREENEQNN